MGFHWGIVLTGAVLFLVRIPTGAPLAQSALLSQLQRAESRHPVPYQATLTTSASMSGVLVRDSGQVEFSPPGCYRMGLFESKSEHATCGDTSWIRSADGSITATPVTHGADRVGMQSLSGWSGGAQSLSALLKDRDFTADSSNNQIVVRLTLDGVGLELSLDKTNCLVRRSVAVGKDIGRIVTTYEYVPFEGRQVPSKVTADLGSFGIITHRFFDYRKTKPRPTRYFRLL